MSERLSVSAEKAAEMLDVSLSTLGRLTRAGFLHPYRVFGSSGPRRYSVAELREFVAKRTVKTVEERNEC